MYDGLGCAIPSSSVLSIWHSYVQQRSFHIPVELQHYLRKLQFQLHSDGGKRGSLQCAEGDLRRQHKPYHKLRHDEPYNLNRHDDYAELYE